MSGCTRCGWPSCAIFRHTVTDLDGKTHVIDVALCITCQRKAARENQGRR